MLRFVEYAGAQEHFSLGHKLMRRLGLTPEAAKQRAIPLRELDRERLLSALGTLGLPDDKYTELQNWVLNRWTGSTLQDLIAQAGTGETGQSTLPGAPAILPPSDQN